jgi:hypothetical protein
MFGVCGGVKTGQTLVGENPPKLHTRKTLIDGSSFCSCLLGKSNGWISWTKHYWCPFQCLFHSQLFLSCSLRLHLYPICLVKESLSWCFRLEGNSQECFWQKLACSFPPPPGCVCEREWSTESFLLVPPSLHLKINKLLALRKVFELRSTIVVPLFLFK